MVGKHLAPLSEGYGYYPDRKHFRRVPSLQVILADLRRGGYSRELPYRRRIVYKRIIEGLRNFMRQRGNILSAAAENSWRCPACKYGDPALLCRWLIAENIAVETQNAAACNLSLVVNREQECIGIDIHRYRVTRVITGKNLSHRGIEIQLVEQQIQHRNKLVRFAAIHDDVSGDGFYDAAAEIHQHGWRN